MTSKHLTVAALAIALSCAEISAQAPSRHVGTLVQAGSHYTLAEFHDPNMRLQFTNDLSQYVDEVVDLTGNVRQSFTGPSLDFDIASIDLADRAFSSDEVGVLGESVRLRVDALGSANFFVWVSTGFGYQPLTTYGPTVRGVLWMDPTLVLSVAGGAMNARWRSDIFIPNSSYLLGMSLHFQAAVHEPGQPLLFLNANEMTFTNTPF